MVDLKKRVFVMLNLTINGISKRDRSDMVIPLEKVRHTLEGSKYSPYEITTWYLKILEEVRTIMYLTEISVEDMIQVLDDLTEHYK